MPCEGTRLFARENSGRDLPNNEEKSRLQTAPTRVTGGRKEVLVLVGAISNRDGCDWKEKSVRLQAAAIQRH
jgi:hypothetical protein